MAIETTSTLTYPIRTNYIAKYQQGAARRRVYDQFAAPVERLGLERIARLDGTITVNFLSAMTPGVTAISETSDVTPQVLKDAQASVTTTSRGEALQFSEKLEISAYTDYTANAFAKVGENQMESVEVLAIASALAGGFKYNPTVRASLDAGTSTHLLTDKIIARVDAMLRGVKMPLLQEDGQLPQLFAVMAPEPYYDLLNGGNVVSIAQYQNASILLNHELGMIGPFRLIVTPFAKVFGSAGADNATNIATTLASAASPLDKTIEVASGTSIAAGQHFTIGTEETTTTFYPTNERVWVDSIASTTVTIIGEGDNGGLRYAHASGAAVRNADSVYPVLFGGPMSIAKAYDAQTGEFGEVVGPKQTGMLEQFNTIGWKFYGGYGRFSESWLLRVEVASGLDA